MHVQALLRVVLQPDLSSLQDVAAFNMQLQVGLHQLPIGLHQPPVGLHQPPFLERW